jgi:hypothetical protein
MEKMMNLKNRFKTLVRVFVRDLKELRNWGKM